jgi:2-oxoglutarate/2-oxoacid ferredoxin oxidoreductase subunit alpha
MEVDRGKLLSQKELDELRLESEKFLKSLNDETPAVRGLEGASAADNYLSVDDNFLRYKVEKDGVSYRTLPGMKGGIHRAATDEHDESGELTETEENRNMMMQKRAKKLQTAIKELPAPTLYGDKNADLTFVTWGSPTEAVVEVIEMLGQKGIKANMLQIIYMLPFHSKEVGEILRGCKRVIGVEMNGEGQLCSLITEKTGYFINDKILKFSGRQFTAHEIFDRTLELINKES